jgi:hypothetical protein
VCIAFALPPIMPSGSMECVRFCGLIAKRWPVVGGVLLVVALGWAVWQALRQPREPVYDGHPISYWLGRMRLQLDTAGPELNVSVFRQVVSDSNSVPFLVKALKTDSWVGAAYYRKWLWPKLPPAIKSHLPPPADNVSTRQTAAILLADLGTMAKPSVPALIRALKEDDNPNVRWTAAAALGNLGKGDKSAKAAVTEALNDKYRWVRFAATNALLKIDPEAAAKAEVKMPSP